MNNEAIIGRVTDNINELYDMFQNARNLPLASDKCIIERDHALDIMDDIIACLPSELESARKIVDARDEFVHQGRKEAESSLVRARKESEELLARSRSEAEKILANAKSEATTMLEDAQVKAQEMVEKEAVYDEAKRQAKEMVEKANEKIAALRKVSNQYMSDALKKTEEVIAASLKDVQETKAKFDALTGEKKEEPKKVQETKKIDIDLD